jgi:probable HAF family extracellular repeat protein
MTRWGWTIWLIVSGVTCKAAHAWPTLYRITQIGGPDVTAYAINNVGQVTGSMVTANGTHAFLYQAGKLIDIGSVTGYDATGLAINDAGQIVGDLTPRSRARAVSDFYTATV